MTDSHESRIFLIRMFVAFLLLTAPHSKKANPHCITLNRNYSVKFYGPSLMRIKIE